MLYIAERIVCLAGAHVSKFVDWLTGVFDRMVQRRERARPSQSADLDDEWVSPQIRH
jgi:hypothetical protein